MCGLHIFVQPLRLPSESIYCIQPCVCTRHAGMHTAFSLGLIRRRVCEGAEQTQRVWQLSEFTASAPFGGSGKAVPQETILYITDHF